MPSSFFSTMVYYGVFHLKYVEFPLLYWHFVACHRVLGILLFESSTLMSPSFHKHADCNLSAEGSRINKIKAVDEYLSQLHELFFSTQFPSRQHQ